VIPLKDGRRRYRTLVPREAGNPSVNPGPTSSAIYRRVSPVTRCWRPVGFANRRDRRSRPVVRSR